MPNVFRRRSSSTRPGAMTPPERPASHTLVLPGVPKPAKRAGLAEHEYRQLVASVRTAPAIPLAELTSPGQAALARAARQRLAQAAGCRPADVRLVAQALPGTHGRVLLFRNGRGHETHGSLDHQQRASAFARALAGFNFTVGIGPGFRIVPGTLSASAIGTVSHLTGRQGLVTQARAGLSTNLAGGAWQWELAPTPTSLGPALSVSAPFVSVEHCPIVGERVDVSVPGVFTVFAAVSPADERRPEIGWLGLVWCQGLLPVAAPGPTANLKLVVGHPALAAPLGPAVHAANRVMSPLQAAIEGLARRLRPHAPPPANT